MATRKQTEPTNQLPAEDLPFESAPTANSSPSLLGAYSPHSQSPANSRYVGGIYWKLSQVQGQIGMIGKSGHNKFQQYDYATEADFLNEVRPLCANAGICMHTTSLFEHTNLGSFEDSKGKLVRTAYVVVQLTLTDVEDGSQLATEMPGYAEDTNGDKALYKAITGATKYAVWKAFGLATGEDPETNDGGGQVNGVKRNQQANQIQQKTSQSNLKQISKKAAYISVCQVRGLDPKQEYGKVQSYYADKSFDQLAEADQDRIVKTVEQGLPIESVMQPNPAIVPATNGAN